MDEEFDYHIRHRAYELWDKSGRPDGKHLDFWKAAERELKAQRKAALNGAPPDPEPAERPETK